MKSERETLEKQVSRIEDEARMVLPGVQAMFGFQLIAITLATLLILTPAAYHRQAESNRISEYFVDLGSRLMCWSMIALAIGICLDCYLICKIIVQSIVAGISLTAVLSVGFYWAWFGFPMWKRTDEKK